MRLLILIFVVFGMVANSSSLKVLVTGAAGRTGALTLRKLLGLPSVEVKGLVRNAKSAKKLKKAVPSSSDKDIVFADIIESSESLDKAFQGVDAVILATSAVPKIKILSILKVLILKLFRKTARPEFTFPKNGEPYTVDWIGAKNQIDAAKRNGVKHFIFISSMGGTQPDNFLNTIGKVDGDEKSGNILIWKRKAEEYLIQSGIPYTIIHPGGLIDKPGGEREIVLGVNDELLKNEKDRSIPRDDVAQVAVEALFSGAAKNRAIDVISKAPGTGTITKDWNSFFSQPGVYKY